MRRKLWRKLAWHGGDITHVFLAFVSCDNSATAAAKLLQSCPTLGDPMDCSLPGFSVHGILQARTLEWVAISFSNAWKWKLKVKSLSHNNSNPQLKERITSKFIRKDHFDINDVSYTCNEEVDRHISSVWHSWHSGFCNHINPLLPI